MTETPHVLAEVTDYPSLLAAFRQRVAELDTTCEALDDLTGFQSGYVSALLRRIPLKRMGARTLGDLLAALGMKFLAVEDAEQMAKVSGRLSKAIRRAKPPTGSPATMTMLARSSRVAPRLYPLSGNPVRAKELSDRVVILTTPAFRKRRARMAARARWTKLRRRLREAAAARKDEARC
jgi:hypothetical protein